jgi:hypothetical protein
MLIEFDERHDWAQYDVVIAGAGRAGLLIAEKLSRTAKVLVLEAGDARGDADFGKGFYELESTGRYTEPLGTRITGVAGTAHQWSPQSLALSPTVFDNRGDIAGWPIRYEEFAHYLPDAFEWMRLPAPSALPDTTLLGGLLTGHAGLSEVRFVHALPNPQYVPELIARFAAMPNVDILSVSEILLADGNRSVAALEFVDRRTGRRHLLPVKRLVLAGGGIENARLLLWSGRRYTAGNPLLGGPNELTGRGYMEHPMAWPFEIYLDRRIDLTLATLTLHDKGGYQFALTLSDALLAKHHLPRFAVSLLGTYDAPAGENGPHGADDRYRAGARDYVMHLPVVQLEQAPCEQSFVALSEKRDAYGDPIARLHWDIRPADIEAYRRAALLFAGVLSQHGVARVKLRPEYCGEDWSAIQYGRGHHHMGTTRMAHAPTAGVVDTDCRVFGIANLYVAGSSVFPNADMANPTANLLTLAARLAAHLERSPPSVARTLRMVAGDESTQILRSGWSAPEWQGVWSDGDRAEIEIDPRGATKLRFHGHAYSGARLRLVVDGRELFSGRARYLFNAQFEIDSGRPLRLVFEFDELTTPKQAGENDDTRRLGVFVTWIDLQ